MNYCYKLLNSRLSYCRDTGVMTWKQRSGTRGSATFNKRFAGKSVGHKDRGGYIGISLNGVWYLAHRVAWVLCNGEIDEGMQIDHLNHDRGDNRIENLRLVKRSENSKNRSPNSNTKYCVGVTYRADRARFKSKISIKGKQKDLGSYKSLFDAVCARKSYENKLGYHKNHGR